MYAALLNKKLVLARQEASLVYQNKKKLNSEKYRCPNCYKKVILVISESKCAFFKHVANYQKKQGEKAEHRESKRLLKTAFTAIGFDAKTEIPLAEGGLRADVLVSPKLALEIQCAPISLEEFNHRHNLYKTIGVLDLWIVGKRHYLKEKIISTQLLFFRENENWGNYYLEINPKKEILCLKYHVVQEPVTNILHYQRICFKLDDIGIKNFWNFKPKQTTYELKINDQVHYLKKQITQKTHFGLKIAEKLYNQHITIDELPKELFSKWRKPGEIDAVSKFLKTKKPNCTTKRANG